MIFEFVFATDLALAFVLLAAALLVGRRPQWRGAVPISVLLLLALASDSAAGTVGLVFVGVLMLLERTWRSRYGAVALVPASALAIGWAVWARSSNPSSGGSVGSRAAFSLHLFLRSAGGIIAGDELAGAGLLAALLVVVVLAVRHRWLHGASLRALVAGLTGALAMTAAIASTRAGSVGSDFTDFNRYIGEVALFLALAIVPAVWTVARLSTPTRAGMWATAGALLFVAVYAVNYVHMRPYRATFEAWNAATWSDTVSAVAKLQTCMPVAASPVRLDPQISRELLVQLSDAGYFGRRTHCDTAPTKAAPTLAEADQRRLVNIDHRLEDYCAHSAPGADAARARQVVRELIRMSSRQPDATAPGPLFAGITMRNILLRFGGLLNSGSCAPELAQKVARAAAGTG